MTHALLTRFAELRKIPSSEASSNENGRMPQQKQTTTLQHWAQKVRQLQQEILPMANVVSNFPSPRPMVDNREGSTSKALPSFLKTHLTNEQQSKGMAVAWQSTMEAFLTTD
jgi:hypothetical protein